MVGMAAVFGTVAILTGRGVRWWSAAGFRGNRWEGRIIYIAMYQVSIYSLGISCGGVAYGALTCAHRALAGWMALSRNVLPQ